MSKAKRFGEAAPGEYRAAPALQPQEWWQEQDDKVLQMVGLEERGDHLPGQLSDGEMQRVAIGRALINDPHIILGDEPTGNLDSATSLMIFDLFRELNRKGLTLIIVTHNKDLARKAEKMYTLRDEKIRVCEIFS